MSVIGKHKPICGQKRSVHSRIKRDTNDFDIVLFKCLRAKINFRFLVLFQEVFQPAAVVDMTVRDHCNINIGNIHTERFCIFQEQSVRSHIKQDFMVFRFRIQR